MKRVVLLTGHFPFQKRRPSMLWVSHHLRAAGWHMTHVTVGYSWLSTVFGDVRLTALDSPPHHGIYHHDPQLSSIYSLPSIHPVKTRNTQFNRLLEPAFSLFANHWRRLLRAPLSRADLVICQSGPPVLLGPLLAEQAPQAARIYRVSDDIRLLNAPDILLRAERDHRHFTRISTASPHIAARFADHPNVTIDPIGIPHQDIRVNTADPYPNPVPAPSPSVQEPRYWTSLPSPVWLTRARTGKSTSSAACAKARPRGTTSRGTASRTSTLPSLISPTPTSASPPTAMNRASSIRRPIPIGSCSTVTTGCQPSVQIGSAIRPYPRLSAIIVPKHTIAAKPGPANPKQCQIGRNWPKDCLKTALQSRQRSHQPHPIRRKNCV